MQDYSIDVFNEDHLKEYEIFLKKAWPKSHYLQSVERIRWRYIENPEIEADKSPLVFIRHKGNIVAQRGIVPFKIFYKNMTIDASWGIDLYVLPEFRKRGLATILQKEWEKRSNICFSTGQSEANYKLYHKIGWKVIGDINTRVKIIDLLAFVGKLIKSNIFVNRIKCVVNKIITINSSKINNIKSNNKLSNSMIDYLSGIKIKYSYLGYVGPIRSAEWFEWRFLKCPYAKYDFIEIVIDTNMIGYAVIRFDEHNKTASLIDYHWNSRDQSIIYSMLRSLCFYFKMKGVQKLFVTSHDKMMTVPFQKNLFINRPYNKRLIASPSILNYMDSCGKTIKMIKIVEADSDIEGV